MTFARNESPGALSRVPIGRMSATLNVLIAGTSYDAAGAAAREVATGSAAVRGAGGGAAEAQPIAMIATQPNSENRRITFLSSVAWSASLGAPIPTIST